MTIEQAARNFFAWFNSHYPAPSIHPDHEWNRLGLALAEPTVPSDCADSHQPVAWRWAVPKLQGVEWRYTLHKTKVDAQPLYTVPPQRKPLTDEAIMAMWPESVLSLTALEFARAIERAHGI